MVLLSQLSPSVITKNIILALYNYTPILFVLIEEQYGGHLQRAEQLDLTVAQHRCSFLPHFGCNVLPLPSLGT